MNEIIYIQEYIHKYKNDYVIIDKDLNKLFNLNIVKIINKYRKLFNKNYCYKLNNNYLLKQDGVVLISLIVNRFYVDKITNYILDTVDILEKINNSILNKISQNVIIKQID